MITDKLGNPVNTPDAWVDILDSTFNGLPIGMAAKLGDADAILLLEGVDTTDEHGDDFSAAIRNTRPSELQVVVPMASLLEMQHYWESNIDSFFVAETGKVLTNKDSVTSTTKWIELCDMDGSFKFLESPMVRNLMRDGFTVLSYNPRNGGLTKIGRDMRGHETYDYVLPAHESYYSVNPFFGLTEYQPPKIADVISL